MKFIPYAKPSLISVDKKHLIKAFDSTWISGGFYVDSFEKNFAKYLNCNNALSVNNGTSAIDLVYQSLDLKKGDEIIFPGYGYMAASNLALKYGYKPKFVDVDPDTLCIDVEKIEKQITKKTKLLVVINTYGNICDFKEIFKITKKHNLNILEEAAESLGSTLNNKQAGTFGDFGTFSFQATKSVTTGEGGMITTKKPQSHFKKLSMIRNHGVDKKRYFHILPGSNFRLTNLQAAIGYSQLKRINFFKNERKKVFKLYQNYLKDCKDISLQKFSNKVNPMIWTLCVTLSPKKKLNRDNLIKKLLKRKIETRNGFYSPNQLKIYKNFKSKEIKISDTISKNIICLPIYPGLKENEIRHISKNLIELIN